MTAVEFRGISKHYHHKPLLSDVNLAIPPNTLSVILGAPACGKSVLMRLLTGLEKPTSGQVFLRGLDVTRVSPGDRNIGYVPQSFALYPHYRVYDNIAYPLKLMNVRKSDIDPVVRQTADLLQIGHLLEKRPNQLSGGEKQRVAIARGIVKNTEIFVMDDPLTGLDFKLREQLFDDLKQLQMALRATVIYTTSDPLEALMLADQVSVLDGGKIVESGPLEQIYARPQHLRSMTLLGFPQASLFTGTLSDDRKWCETALFKFPVQANGSAAGMKAVTVGVRPQDIRLESGINNGWLTRPAQVTLTEDLGGELMVYLEADGLPLVSVVQHDEAHLLSSDTVTIAVKPESLVLFAPDGGQCVGLGAG